MRVISASLLSLLSTLLATGCTHREHPYLAFDKAEIPALRERAQQRPYSFWIDVVRANAVCGMKFTPGQANPPCPATPTVPPGLSCAWASGATNESCQSAYAFNLALAATIHPNDDYVQKAASLLMSAGKYEKDWNKTAAGGWYWGSDLQNYGYAYDMIQPSLSSQQDRAIIGVLGGVMSRTMLSFLNPFNTAYVTNVRLRVGGGAGTLALALDRHDFSGLWAETIERNLFSDTLVDPFLVSRYVSTTVTQAGTLNEGPSYQNDAFDVMLPYLYILKRLEGRDYINGKNTLPGWKDDNRIAKMFERNAALSMPDKNSATFGTGWRFGFTDGNVAAPGIPFQGNEQVKWFFGWQEGSGTTNQTNSAISFLYTNSSLPRTEPSYLSLVTPDWSSFRSGWDQKAMFFLMQSEHWPEYSTHGQPDQTSFILYAKNRYLLLDPGDGRNYCATGYSSCSQYMQINKSPEAHNLVVVDGKRGCNNSAQTPARLYGSYTKTRDPVKLLAGFVSSELSSSMVTLQNYFSVSDVSTYRTAMMARNRYVVVFDGMSSTNQKSHAYDSYLHFGGPLSNTAKICHAAESGESEACGPGDSDKFCLDIPDFDESSVIPPNVGTGIVDASTESVPRSCNKTGPSPLPPGVTDCGTVVGTLEGIGNGADRIAWKTTSKHGDPIELYAVFAPAPMSFAQGTYPTNFYANALFTHPYVGAHYEGGTTQWLNVLYPRDANEKDPAPTITSKPVKGGNGAALSIRLDALTIDDLGIVSDGSASITVGDDVSFQGRAAMILRTADKLVRVNVHEARSLSVKENAVFSADQSMHATISWLKEVIAAEIVTTVSTQVCLPVRSPGGSLSLDHRPAETTRVTNGLACTMIPTGEHVLEAL